MKRNHDGEGEECHIADRAASPEPDNKLFDSDIVGVAEIGTPATTQSILLSLQMQSEEAERRPKDRECNNCKAYV